MLRYDRAYPLSRVKSTDSDGLKCWKELVGRLPSATPNPRRGVSNGGRRSREFRILASGLDGSMPLTVSWPPSRNHPLPLFLLFLLFPILFLPRLYSTVNHNAFRTRLYRILRIKCRNSLSALSTHFSLDPYSLSLSYSSRSNVQIRRKKDKRKENPSRFTQKNWKRHAASNGLLYLLAKRSLAFLLFSKGEKISSKWKKSAFHPAVEKQSNISESVSESIRGSLV